MGVSTSCLTIRTNPVRSAHCKICYTGPISLERAFIFHENLAKYSYNESEAIRNAPILLLIEPPSPSQRARGLPGSPVMLQQGLSKAAPDKWPRAPCGHKHIMPHNQDKSRSLSTLQDLLYRANIIGESFHLS